MKAFDLSSIKASDGGDFVTVEPGAYMCVVTAVEDKPQYDCIDYVLDFADGELAGSMEGSKPFFHSVTLWYNENGESQFAYAMQAFEESNPGFSTQAAINADKPELFVGKKVPVVWRNEEYYNRNNAEFAMTSSARPWKIVKQADMSKPNYASPKDYTMKAETRRKKLVAAGEDPERWDLETGKEKPIDPLQAEAAAVNIPF